jgi:hypothetical protein
VFHFLGKPVVFQFTAGNSVHNNSYPPPAICSQPMADCA